jgi:hypothetical protein
VTDFHGQVRAGRIVIDSDSEQAARKILKVAEPGFFLSLCPKYFFMVSNCFLQFEQSRMHR